MPSGPASPGRRWRSPPAAGARPGQRGRPGWSARAGARQPGPGQRHPAPGLGWRGRAGRFVRRHRLGPYLLLLPSMAGMGLVLLWPSSRSAMSEPPSARERSLDRTAPGPPAPPLVSAAGPAPGPPARLPRHPPLRAQRHRRGGRAGDALPDPVAHSGAGHRGGQPAVRRPRSASLASLRLSFRDRPRASGGSRQIVLPPMRLKLRM